MLKKQRAQGKIETGLFGSVFVKFDWEGYISFIRSCTAEKGPVRGYIGKERASRGVQTFTVAKGLLISQV